MRTTKEHDRGNTTESLRIQAGIFCSLAFVAMFPVSALAFDATLFISPSIGSFRVNDLVTARVYVSSDGAKINGAEGALSFNPNEIEVKSLSWEDSVLSSWPDAPSFDNVKGEIKWSGAMATATALSRGKILEINFTPLRVGMFRLEFVNGAAMILVADGTGGNIVSSLKNAQYNVEPSDNSALLDSETRGEILGAATETFFISSTHPDQNAWYQNAAPSISWTLPNGVLGIKLGVDRKENGLGRVSYNPPIKTKDIPTLEDGVWYFHLTAEFDDGSVKTDHYRFQIDTTPPTDLQFVEAERTDPPDGSTTFLLSATDTASGIDRYEIVVNQGAPISWKDDGSHQFRSEKLSPGTHEFVARVFDRAGNSTEAQQTIAVESTAVPVLELLNKEAKEGDSLRFNISSVPNSLIEVSISRDKNMPVVEEFTLDDTGHGIFSSALTLVPGTYQAWSVLRYESGERSKQSNWVAIEVTPSLMGTIRRHPSIPISAGALVVLFLAIIFFWRRARHKSEYHDEELPSMVATTTRSKPSHRVVLGEKERSSVFEPTRL